jgi:hypothetical protein
VVCRGGLAIFRPMVQELLNIEQILLKKFKINKKSKLHVIEMEMCRWNGKLATQVEVLLNLLWPWQLQPCIHNLNLL